MSILKTWNDIKNTLSSGVSPWKSFNTEAVGKILDHRRETFLKMRAGSKQHAKKSNQGGVLVTIHPPKPLLSPIDFVGVKI